MIFTIPGSWSYCLVESDLPLFAGGKYLRKHVFVVSEYLRFAIVTVLSPVTSGFIVFQNQLILPVS